MIIVGTRSGKEFDLMDFDASLVTIEGIASALSKLCRYNGQLHRYYSVAEHSVLLANHFKGNETRAKVALLHDASEAFMGDIIAPIKNQLPNISLMEEEIVTRIMDRFEVEMFRAWNDVMVADKRIRIDEVQQLRSGDTPDWMKGEPLGVDIIGLSPEAAEGAFLLKARELGLE